MGYQSNTGKEDAFDIDKNDVSKEYIIALLAQMAEGITKLQGHLDKSENSRKNVEVLIENTVRSISKINDEINIRKFCL